MTLGQSVCKMMPTADFYIVLADEPVDEGLPDWNIITVSDIDIDDLASQSFLYSVMEFATAIKPNCFKHFLECLNYEAAIYLDPDIQLFAPLDRVDEAFRDGASSALTPHLLSPLRDGKSPSDLDILQSGTFNLGFAAFRNCDESDSFLSWWREKLRFHCYNDLRKGLFVDQKFADFAPSFLPSLHVIRDPGYNVAYWNLLNRPIIRDESGWRAGDAPLTFFHFSGVVPGNPGVFSKHQDRFSMDDVGAAGELVTNYLGKLAANGHSKWSNVPYGYGHFRNGVTIPDIIRRAPASKKQPSEWWEGFDTPYWGAPSERVDQEQDYVITRLMLAVHDSRPDIQEKFPLSSERGRRQFVNWFAVYGASEHRIDEEIRAACLPGAARGRSRFARLRSRLSLFFS